MATATTSPGSPPFAKGSIIWEKRGPLPVWAWALLLLAVLVVIVSWRRGRGSSGEDVTHTFGPDGSGWPAPVVIVPQQPVPPIYVNTGGAGGGAGGVNRSRTRVPLPVDTSGPITQRPPHWPAPTPPQTPPAGGTTPPQVQDTPKPAPPGIMVPVEAWGNPAPWNSSLWGIWNRYRTTGRWEDIWHHPMNNELRSRRGVPENIRKGDLVFVPGAV